MTDESKITKPPNISAGYVADGYRSGRCFNGHRGMGNNSANRPQKFLARIVTLHGVHLARCPYHISDIVLHLREPRCWKHVIHGVVYSKDYLVSAISTPEILGRQLAQSCTPKGATAKVALAHAFNVTFHTWRVAFKDKGRQRWGLSTDRAETFCDSTYTQLPVSLSYDLHASSTLGFAGTCWGNLTGNADVGSLELLVIIFHLLRTLGFVAGIIFSLAVLCDFRDRNVDLGISVFAFLTLSRQAIKACAIAMELSGRFSGLALWARLFCYNLFGHCGALLQQSFVLARPVRAFPRPCGSL